MCFVFRCLVYSQCYCVCLSFLFSLSVTGPNRHAGGSGDTVWASALEETKEVILYQEK